MQVEGNRDKFEIIKKNQKCFICIAPYSKHIKNAVFEKHVSAHRLQYSNFSRSVRV